MSLTVKINPPHLPASLRMVSGKQLKSGTLKRFRLKSEDLSGICTKNLDMGEGLVESASFDGAKLNKILANDVSFGRASLATADCSESSFTRVEITDCRLTGWDANQSIFEDVVIKGCKLDMANFRSCKLKRVRFSECILAESDFLGAELEGVEFQDCLIEKAQFSQCKMKNVDFRSSQLIDISGWQSLKGATIDSVQLTSAAPYLANELGIKVDD